MRQTNKKNTYKVFGYFRRIFSLISWKGCITGKPSPEMCWWKFTCSVKFSTDEGRTPLKISANFVIFISSIYLSWDVHNTNKYRKRQGEKEWGRARDNDGVEENSLIVLVTGMARSNNDTWSRNSEVRLYNRLVAS